MITLSILFQNPITIRDIPYAFLLTSIFYSLTSFSYFSFFSWIYFLHERDYFFKSVTFFFFSRSKSAAIHIISFNKKSRWVLEGPVGREPPNSTVSPYNCFFPIVCLRSDNSFAINSRFPYSSSNYIYFFSCSIISFSRLYFAL